MSKIIFFDIDGTLHCSGLGIPESTMDALKKLIENGHKIVMCTGRSKGMIPEDYFHMGFHGMVLGGGAYVVYEGKVLHHQLMTEEEVRKVVNWGKQEDIGIILEGEKFGYYDTDNRKEYYLKMVEKTERDCEVKLHPLEEASIISKWSYHHMDPERKKIIEDILDGKYVGTYHKPADSVEFLPSGIDKAKGIEEILKDSGIPWEDSYAFGDSANDIPMIRYVHYGVAMGNAIPELMEEAEYRTERVDKDGISIGLKRFGLID